VPAPETLGRDITTDPDLYFQALTEAEQNKAFGKANAQAIRDGAEISKVVNVRRNGGLYTADDGRRYTYEGTRKGGFTGNRADRVRRPTPWQIYKDAEGDQERAIALLKRFRYIVA
jgi:hypothetical protein